MAKANDFACLLGDLILRQIMAGLKDLNYDMI